MLEAPRCLRQTLRYGSEMAGTQISFSSSVSKTLTVQVEDIPLLRSWLRCLLAQVLQPMISVCFPQLADGSSFGDAGSRLRVHDAFIVRYDASKDMSTSLPEHSDTSIVSFTLALNSPSRDEEGSFAGGGTWFRALESAGCGSRGEDFHPSGVVDATAGQVVAFAGPLRHGGFPILSGCRYILVLFLYADSFPYQQYLRESGCSPICPASAHTKQTFVVYRETLELMTTLNKLQEL